MYLDGLFSGKYLSQHYDLGGGTYNCKPKLAIISIFISGGFYKYIHMLVSDKIENITLAVLRLETQS